MSGTIVLYLVGFACVWAAVALGSAAVAAFRRLERDWDRAFIKELQGEDLIQVRHR